MCLQQEFAKVHNKLHHYALVEVIKKQIWIVSFGVRMKKKCTFQVLTQPKLARPDLR
jgi:hypothetical protein